MKKALLAVSILLAWGAILLLRPALVKAYQEGVSDDSSQLYLPHVAKYYTSAPGNVSGIVYDAHSGNPITTAVVCFGSICTSVDSGGQYTLADISPGWRIFAASDMDSGYYSLERGVAILPQGTSILNFALAPSLAPNEMRVVLTWDPTPEWCDPQGQVCEANDLDAHMWVPVDEHIYWNNKSVHCDIAPPYACLRPDAIQGGGPETMWVYLRNGDYTYVVDNYAYVTGPDLAPPFPGTAAEVNVYDHTGLVKTYLVPKFGDGRWWHVFDMDGSGIITDVNMITDTQPGGTW